MFKNDFIKVHYKVIQHPIEHPFLHPHRIEGTERKLIGKKVVDKGAAPVFYETAAFTKQEDIGLSMLPAVGTLRKLRTETLAALKQAEGFENVFKPC